ncbi:hypothetical protein IPF08_27960, partial [Escherichia coli]|nr:hypothetical protein [Escherichia coli]
MATAGVFNIRAANNPEKNGSAVFKTEKDIKSTKKEKKKTKTKKSGKGFCIFSRWLAIFGNYGF